MKFIGILLVVILLALGVVWYSMQSLPTWFDEQANQEQQVADALSKKISEQGVEAFLGNKILELVRGQVSFDETEFNALLIASLKLHEDGQKLIQVSDGVRAILHENEIEIAAVINLDKVEKIDPKARKAVERFDKFFFFLDDARLAISVYGTPVVRNGSIAIKDDFHIKVGAIPISNSTLRQLGIEVERANDSELVLQLLNLSSVTLEKGNISFAARPRI